jgi:hypothetical protein
MLDHLLTQNNQFMKNFNYVLLLIIAFALLTGCEKNTLKSDGGETGGESGKAGSMAKFSISNNNLFLINDSSLLVYDISDESNPVQINKIDVNFGIETVYTLKEKLFIGAIDGVYIYDISEPDNILYLSHYQHITSCDPVVANDEFAFATLNSQSQCRWQTGSNQLDVIDISNIVYPHQVSSVFMENPQGLAIDSNYVFVCNGEFGLKIFDFSNPNNLHQISGISGIDAYDIILDDQILYLIGKQGLFQYNYENIDNIQLLSNILF